MKSARVAPARPGPALALLGLMALIALMALLLAGCASHEGIAPSLTPRSAQAYGARSTAVTWPRSDWWTGLGDAQLDALVVQALSGNPQLGTAQARLARAQAAAAGAQAALAPQIELQGQSTWQHYSANSLYPPPLGGSAEVNLSLQLAGRWEFDFFGRHRAALQAALATGRAAAAEAQAARVLIASSVVRSYLLLAHQLRTHELLQATLQQRTRLRELLQARVDKGLDNTLALRQADAACAELQRQIERSTEQAMLTRHAIAALVGVGPQITQTLAPRMTGLATPPLPAALPAELIGRRADLSAARWRVQAALAQVDAAKAQFYPNVNLLAFAGLQSLGFAHWLDAGSRNFGIGPAITLPLFDAGALRAQLSARSAEADAAIADYNTTLGDAVRDVADQVASLQSLQRQAQAQQAAQGAADAAQALAEQRYRAGIGTYASVLTQQGDVLTQQRAAADLQARRADTIVALMRALGGGFEADPATPTPDPHP